jgi:GTPase SAR1 family protein
MENPETSPMRAHRTISGGSGDLSIEATRARSEANDSEGPESEKQMFRCKVCVVGPSRWGKTSFIKSFTSGSSTLEDVDVRTIGIDLFPWSFDVETEAGGCEYQVSFWDFAGQEEYRAAHTLFYSSRTLYLLCVNLERYAKALAVATNSTDQSVDDHIMDAFAEMHVFRWVRMICAHHPQAEFIFLGTKADLVRHERRKIAAIQQDLVGRFKAYVRRAKDRMQRALQELQDARFEIQDSDPNADTSALDEQIAGCEQILRKQPVLLSEELIAFSSADMKCERVARGKLKALLMLSGSSVLLPPSYAELLRHAQQRSVSSQKLQPSFQEKVDLAFLSVSDFVASVVCSSTRRIPEDELLAALHLLHDTGDIVWFDGVSDVRLLQERLFLDPVLVIEFIRQVANHKTDSADGHVSHAQLQALPFWRDVSTTTVHQLKELLLHLHLAYSAGKAKRMAWNSDLIVPVYWNRAADASRSVEAAPAEEGLVACVRWEYSFEPAIPDNLFEKLAVTTRSPLLRSERRCAGSSFVDRTADEYSGGWDTAASALSISVAARERTLAWKQLVWNCMNLEKLLKTYPGLLVTRCTVSQRGQRFNVDQLLSDQEHFAQLSLCTEQEFLPADMDWYTNRSRQLKPVEEAAATQPAPVKMWSSTFRFKSAHKDNSLAAEMALLRQDVLQLASTVGAQSSSIERQFQQNERHLDAAVSALQRSQIALITGMKNKAKFPSLWTLEYHGFESDGCVGASVVASLQKKVTTTVAVKFRSDLSGR